MDIVIHCGGMPFNGETIKTQSLGGSESAAYYLAKELSEKGHRVTMFTNGEGGKFDGVHYVNAGTRSEHTPLGEYFHFYAANTPHDVLIIQRHPMAFSFEYASKMNFLWLHDVPNKEQIRIFNSQMWNISGVLTVSDYHKKIVVDAYKIDPNFVFSIENGVDGSLYEKKEISNETPNKVITYPTKFKFNMVYSSRPERGLEHLVREGGIMHTLAEQKTNHHLYVCAYDNVTEQMKGYYDYLNQCIEQLPNVTSVGALTKQQLANLQLNCDLAVYPTEFEEVSCITAMECMFAGLPLLTSNHAALKETCKNSGTILLDHKKGQVVEQKFIDVLKTLTKDILSHHKIKQLNASQSHTWKLVSDRLLNIIHKKFSVVSIENKAKQLMRNGDIYALDYLFKSIDTKTFEDSFILVSIWKEMKLYDFAFEDKFAEHYKAYYEYEKNRGVDYGKEELAGNSRFEVVSAKIAKLYEQAGVIEHTMTVLDYGCAHGHYTVNLAKRFPHINFVGVDIAASNIDKANEWSINDGVKNVTFINSCVKEDEISPLKIGHFDVIIAAEVIEHVATPIEHVEVLNKYLSDDGLMILTTPYGTWEYIAVKEHHPWRAHIHHFDRQDIYDVFGKCEGLNIDAIPSGKDRHGQALGSYVTSFKKFDDKLGAFDYDRKIKETLGRETVSVCMIVKDGEKTLGRTLDGVEDIADEIIIALDETTTDRTQGIIESFELDNPLTPVKVINIKSPTETGFAEARNSSVQEASGDWILWIDADEVMDRVKLIARYLRDNQHKGYAVTQHHFSLQPAGVLKTDFPTRLFRNNSGIKFFGVVHEHPEIAINKGVPFCSKVEGSEISHQGYQNEEIRRKRFERNFKLMVRDRKENPTRLLGKFLWVRDMAQMCMFEFERTGKHSQSMIDTALDGLLMWRELLKGKHLRLTVDSLEFVSSINKVLSKGKGREFAFKINAGNPNTVDLNKAREIRVFFNDKSDAEKLFKMLLDESIKILD